MKTNHPRRDVRTRVLSYAVGLAILAAPFAGAAPSASASGVVESRPSVAAASTTFSLRAAAPLVTVTGTVPNHFVRNCSYITRRCTGYRQVNGPYNRHVPSRYFTQWVWRWI